VEACAFRDRAEQFAQLDTIIIGISVDTLEAQEAFAKKENLKFPLFADAGKKAAEAYGVMSARGFANRNTFVIDKQGVVKKIYTQVKPAEHADEVLKYVKENLAKSS
jgi:thioredoxin-dependent peroxiredoxin